MARGFFGDQSAGPPLIIYLAARLLFFLSFFITHNIEAAEIAGNTDAPIHLKARSLQYFKEKNIFLAHGETVVEQEGMRLEADMVRFNETSRQLSGMGRIHFFDGANQIDAERIEINIDSKLGWLYKGRLFLKESNYYIEGKEIIRRAEDEFELSDGSFTACDCQENPAWRIRAGHLDLTVDEYLVAKHTRFYVKDVPFFYLPYFIYPAKRDRQTGLLVPRVGYSSEHGFRYKQALFIALNDHQDTTIALEHRGDKGDGVGLEYRYFLSKKGRGELNAEFFRDKEDQVDRWYISLNHEQQFTSRVQGKLDLRYQSETNNLRELSDRTLDRAQQNIESNLSLTYQGDNAYAYLLARYTQDLNQVSNDETPQRLPEIGYSLIEYRPGNAPFYLNFDTTAVNFWSKAGLNLQRVDLYPKLSLPIPIARGITLTPWAGFRETWYRHGQQDDSDIYREIIPAGISFEGQSTLGWGQTTQIVQASLFYEDINVRDDDALVQIDELDSVHDRQNITAMLTQRFIQHSPHGFPEEKATLRFTETYHPNQIDSASGSTRRFSDLRTELFLYPGAAVSLKVDAFYHVYRGQLTSVGTDLGLALSSYLHLNLGQRTTRGDSVPIKGDLFNPHYVGDREAVAPEMDFWSAETTINTPWGVRYVNRIYYDSKENEMVEIGHLLEYHAQCWGIGLSYVEFHDRNEFSFVISLKGLGELAPN